MADAERPEGESVLKEKVEMTEEQEQWLGQAAELARVKRYDEAREVALRVLREDGSNPKALWIVASSTNSLAERRNALRTLVRVQPQNHHARQMLNSIEQEIKSTNSSRSNTIAAQPLKPTFQPMLLYAIAIAVLVLVAAALIVATL